ncbi:MAG TPA: hypothetical protein VFS31_05775, partial [Chitinophagaceae bacterium]|nr:hypothetical protein [Chitinophagaceae bacterium]
KTYADRHEEETRTLKRKKDIYGTAGLQRMIDSLGTDGIMRMVDHASSPFGMFRMRLSRHIIINILQRSLPRKFNLT